MKKTIEQIASGLSPDVEFGLRFLAEKTRTALEKGAFTPLEKARIEVILRIFGYIALSAVECRFLSDLLKDMAVELDRNTESKNKNEQ